MERRHTYTMRLTAITLGVLAVVSPLYIDRKPQVTVEPEDEAEKNALVASLLLPLVLVSLVAAISVASFLDRRYVSLDPYLIHRVGGSSFGIAAFLLMLGLVLKFKSVALN